MGSVVKYYEGKNIFITGGSGFLGKVIIEKLLRSCPGIGNIYVLLRPKKGQNIQERLSDIKEKALFDVVRESNPAALNKLIPIYGDVVKLRLGLSEEDRKLLINNVHIIIHAAASVRFDDSLKYAIILNVRGTRETLQLALDVKNLSVFVHISTTFCNTDKKVVEEKIYPPHADWRESIEIAETVEDNVLNATATKYINPLPNTYTFAKSLAEHTVNDMSRGKIPAIIMRPSIVLSTSHEPFSGWIDNWNGPVGLFYAAGKGVLRTVLGHSEVIQDYIPVDIVVKWIVVAVHVKAVTGKKDGIEVYNCSKHESLPVALGGIVEMGADMVEDSPLSQMLWYPRVRMTSCWYNYYIQVIAFHMIPAIFIDLLLMIAGKKRMLFKIQKKIYIANVILEFFMRHSWTFVNTRALSLSETLLDEEKKIFGTIEEFSLWEREDVFDYWKKGALGAALYLLKEDYDFTKSRKNLRRLRILDRIVKIVFFGFVLWFLTLKFNVLKYISNGLDNYIRSL